jgi:hypothetical protein
LVNLSSWGIAYGVITVAEDDSNRIIVSLQYDPHFLEEIKSIEAANGTLLKKLELSQKKVRYERTDQTYLKNGVLNDPWGLPYIYKSLGHRRDYDLISYGADGYPGGEGENKDIMSEGVE